MKKRENIKIIVSLFLATGFTISCVIFNNSTPQVVYDNRVPMAPREKRNDGYYIWDSPSRQWEFVSYTPDRANAKVKPVLDEDKLQRYLEKKIPGYLEDTYWGEEYDLDDDDEYDEDED